MYIQLHLLIFQVSVNWGDHMMYLARHSSFQASENKCKLGRSYDVSGKTLIVQSERK